jgi:hypothetical protein
MESGNHNDRVATIEGLEETLLETRVVGGNGIIMCGIEKGIVFDHILGHVVGPF